MKSIALALLSLTSCTASLQSEGLDLALAHESIGLVQENWTALRGPVDVYEILDTYNVRMFVVDEFFPAQPSTVSGITVFGDGDPYIEIKQWPDGENCSMYTALAHELLHILCKYEAGVSDKENIAHHCGNAFVDDAPAGSDYTQTIEYQAEIQMARICKEER